MVKIYLFVEHGPSLRLKCRSAKVRDRLGLCLGGQLQAGSFVLDGRQAVGVRKCVIGEGTSRPIMLSALMRTRDAMVRDWC